MLARVSDDELLERLIGRTIEDRGLRSLLELDPEGLHRAGLSDAETSLVMVVAEISRRHQPRDLDHGAIGDPSQVVGLLGDLRLCGSASLMLVLFDHRHRLLVTICAEESVIDCPRVSPIFLAEQAQGAGAAAAIIAHNHPHGVTTPTPADITFTREVGQALVRVGVDLIDHLVVARRDWFSFRRAGILYRSP